MKPGIVVAELTHRRDEIRSRNEAVDRLSEQILPLARELVRSGVSREMRRVHTEVVLKEAEVMLQTMLPEIGVDPGRLAGSGGRLLHDGPEHHADMEAWLEQLAQDFALASAAFCQSRGHARPVADDSHSLSGDGPTRSRREAPEDAFRKMAARFHVVEPDRMLAALGIRQHEDALEPMH